MFFLYYSYRHEVIQHDQQKLLTLAKLTASMINSNDFNQLVSPSDEKSKEYRQIKDILVRVKRASADVKYMLGTAAMIFFSFGITAFLISQRIKNVLEPLNEIIEGIKQVGCGNLDYRVNLKTNDELGIIANMVNQAANIMISNQKILEKYLQITIEQRQNTFKVYSDVVYSVTQGKFNLISYKDSILIADEGVFEGETKLENAEDVGKARALVEGYLTRRGCSDDRIQTILFSVSEAATNVIKHAKDGVVQIRILEDSVRLVVLDHGSGMDFNKLPNMIFLRGFSTKTSLGVGFSIIYKFADKIYLSTAKNGTFIVMDFLIEPNAKQHPLIAEKIGCSGSTGAFER